MKSQCGSLFGILLGLTVPLFAAEAPTLQIVTGDRFIIDLRYDTENNFLHKNVYRPFGLNQCFVHRDMREHLEKLEKPLAEAKLKPVLSLIRVVAPTIIVERPLTFRWPQRTGSCFRCRQNSMPFRRRLPLTFSAPQIPPNDAPTASN
jgi:hypothetical protein